MTRLTVKQVLNNNAPLIPRLECEILLAFVLQQTRTFLYTHQETILQPKQLTQFNHLRSQRQYGIPIAYLIGKKEFWSLPFLVNEATLIPRPETELLVEQTLNLLPQECPARILELGTGSGIIALALASERPHWRIDACDISESALQIAKKNQQSLGINNVEFIASDWYSHVPNTERYDAIVSNPPYIAESDPHLLEGDLIFEPRHALASGPVGLDALEKIIRESLARLKKNGLLLLEHGYDQKLQVTDFMQQTGYHDICTWKDLQGHDRVTVGYH